MNHSAGVRHAEFEEMISAALDGLLSRRDHERLEEHLGQCAPCAKMRLEMESNSGLLSGFPREEMPEALRASLLAMARNTPMAAIPGRRGTLSPYRWALAPAAAAVLLVVVWVSSPIDPEIPVPKTAPEPALVAETEAIEERQDAAQVPDGAKTDEPPPGGKKDSSPRRRATRSPAGAVRAESDESPSRPDVMSELARPPHEAVASRFRSRLLISGSEMELDALVPIATRRTGTLVARSVTRVAPQEPARISLTQDDEPPTAGIRAGAAAPAAAAAPTNDMIPAAVLTHPVTIQFLLKVEGSGRILEAHIIGAQAAPRDLTDAIIAWLTGAVIRPHDEGEPSSIALELEVPISHRLETP